MGNKMGGKMCADYLWKTWHIPEKGNITGLRFNVKNKDDKNVGQSIEPMPLSETGFAPVTDRLHLCWTIRNWFFFLHLFLLLPSIEKMSRKTEKLITTSRNLCYLNAYDCIHAFNEIEDSCHKLWITGIWYMLLYSL